MAPQGEAGRRLAVVGASGSLGTQLLELIEERVLPYRELVLYRAEPLGEDSVEVAGVRHRLHRLDSGGELADFDLVFLATPRAAAQQLAAEIAGPVVIDLSSHELMPAAAPLLAPGFVSRQQVRRLTAGKLVHVPHPVALALATIWRALEPPFLSVTALLSASVLGRDTVKDLVQQSADLLNGRLDLADNEVQFGFNAAPFATPALASAVLAQTARLLGAQPAIALQLVRIPILHGVGLAVSAPPDTDSRAWPQRLRAAAGVLLVEEEPTLSVIDAIGQEALLISLYPAASGPGLWCAMDNARSAALTALWVAECLSAAEPLH
jgi:aspartate-semialdehyde dehydrogenase